MDTKLKNINSSKILKTVAVTVALVMFFTSGYFLSLFVRGFGAYNIYENRDYYQTTAFRTLMNNYEFDVLTRGESASCTTLEDFKKTSTGKSIIKEQNAIKQEISQAHDLLYQSGIEFYIDTENRYRYSLVYNNVNYLFRYDGGLISYDEFHSLDYVIHGAKETEPVPFTAVHLEMPVTDAEGNTAAATAPHNNGVVMYYNPYSYSSDEYSLPKYIADISTALSILNERGSNTCYGEMSKEDLLAMVDAEYADRLVSQFEWNSGIGTSRVRRAKNMSYAVFYKTTGKVVSNCGVTATDTHEQVIQKLGDATFAECLVNGKYQLLVSEPYQESDSAYAALHKTLFGSYYDTSNLVNEEVYADKDKISAAYFALTIPDSIDGIDYMSVSHNAYNDYMHAPVKSLNTCLVVAAISFLIACAACIYLLRKAGKTADGIKTNFFDKIPFEINLVVCLGLMFLFGFAVFGLVVVEMEPCEVANWSNYLTRFIALPLSSVVSGVTALCFSAFFGIWTALTASFIRNIRNKTFLKRTICYFILKPVRWIFSKLKKGTKNLVAKAKYLLDCDYSNGKGEKFKIIACIAVGGFIVLTAFYYFFATLLMFSWSDGIFGLFLLILGVLGDIAIMLYALLIVASQDRIMSAVHDIKNGNLSRKIDMKFMPLFMRRFSEDILSMQDGLQNAVENAVKDQRMKAELITNVSHDLKTPLTSIVNYVDLLKKCEIEDETAQRYVSILDEKAQRMKKLIEDLVEASKASSGAMEIHPVKLNLCELAAQAIGEHSDELNNLGIELVLKTNQAPVTVMADAQKTSRIVENLFSNIRKYAMERTRVYIEVSEDNSNGYLVLKNISKYALDISPDELTQRFVRGDASRTGEGSGLGLSIAKNLCELQKGALDVRIDGDLFKVTIKLPKA